MCQLLIVIIIYEKSELKNIEPIIIKIKKYLLWVRQATHEKNIPFYSAYYNELMKKNNHKKNQGLSGQMSIIFPIEHLRRYTYCRTGVATHVRQYKY